MKYRLPAALAGLALLGSAISGCTSQQQQPNLSYSAPASPMPPPAMPAAAPAVPQPAAPDTRPAVTAAGFPPPPSCEAGSLDPSCAPATQERKCRTVGSVTTCDVPADPDADSRLYTN